MTAALPWNSSTDSPGSFTFEATGEESSDRLTRWTSILNALQMVDETMQEWNNDQVTF